MKAWAGHFSIKRNLHKIIVDSPLGALFYLLNNILIFSSFSDFNQLLNKFITNFSTFSTLQKSEQLGRNYNKIILKNFWKKHLRKLYFLHEHNVLLVLDHSNCFPPLFAQNLKLKSKSERKQQKFNRIISFFITSDYSTKILE